MTRVDHTHDAGLQAMQRDRRRAGYMVFYGSWFSLEREVDGIFGPIEPRVAVFMTSTGELWRTSLAKLINDDQESRRELITTVTDLFEAVAGRTPNGEPRPWDGVEPLTAYYVRAVSPLVKPLEAALATDDTPPDVADRLTALCAVLDRQAARIMPLLRRYDLAVLHANRVRQETEQERALSDYTD